MAQHFKVKQFSSENKRLLRGAEEVAALVAYHTGQNCAKLH